MLGFWPLTRPVTISAVGRISFSNRLSIPHVKRDGTAKILIFLEIFTEENIWEKWIHHFYSVTTVKESDDRAKLKCLHVHRIERAPISFQTSWSDTICFWGRHEVIARRFQAWKQEVNIYDKIAEMNEEEKGRLGHILIRLEIIGRHCLLQLAKERQDVASTKSVPNPVGRSSSGIQHKAE